MGRRILILNEAIAGRAMPWVVLAGELVRRGHRVSYVTTDDYAIQLERGGVEVVPFATTADTSSPLHMYASQFDGLWNLKENSAIVDAAKTRFADEPPDLVLYATNALYAGCVLSRGWQRPAVMLSPAFADGPDYSLPRELARRSPNGGGDYHLSDFGKYMLELGSFISTHGANVKVPAELFSAFEELTIVNIPREFQISGDTFDERWVFAGPFLDDRASQDQWEPPGDDPVLLVSLGSISYGGQQGFLETCVSAFSGLDWHVIISTGLLDPADLGPLPPNIEAHQRVPQLAILKKAKLFVSHAGMGGTMEALSIGVPILAFPQLPEDTICADRIAELGLGRRCAQDISAGELRAAALEVAGDASVASALAEMREHIKKAGGTPRAADEIETYLRTHGS